MLDYNKLMINDLLKQSGRVPHSVDEQVQTYFKSNNSVMTHEKVSKFERDFPYRDIKFSKFIKAYSSYCTT